MKNYNTWYKKATLILLGIILVASNFIITNVSAAPLVELDENPGDNLGFSLQEVYTDDELNALDAEAAEDSRRLIVTYKNQTPVYSIVSRKYRKSVIKQENISNYVQTISVTDDKVLNELMSALKNNSLVECVDLDKTVEAFDTGIKPASVDDPYYSNQWWLDDIGAPDAWDNIVPQSGKEVIVAVIDTGCDVYHKELYGRIAPGAKNFSDSTEKGVTDVNGHGTFCAGEIAAKTNNGIGGASVANNFPIKILPLKALDDSGSGYYSWVINAIDYAVAKGANVISMSLGGSDYSSSYQAACTRARNAGVTVVAAAGNTYGTDYRYPASFNYVISVGAYETNHTIAAFSTNNNKVDIAAPGVDIYSTLPGNQYGYDSGTSMACPIVAGACALLKLENYSRTPAQIEYILKTTAVDYGPEGKDNFFGSGALDLNMATLKPEVISADIETQDVQTNEEAVFTVITNKAVKGITVKLGGVVQSGFESTSVISEDTITWTLKETVSEAGRFTYRFQASNLSTAYKLKAVNVSAPNGEMPAVETIVTGPAYVNEPKTISWTHSVDNSTYNIVLYKGSTKIKEWTVVDVNSFVIPAEQIQTEGYYTVKIKASKVGYSESEIKSKMFKTTAREATIDSVSVNKSTALTHDDIIFTVKTAKTVTDVVVKYGGKVQTDFEKEKTDKGTYYEWKLTKTHTEVGSFTYRFEAANNPTSYKYKKVTVTAPNGQAPAATNIQTSPTTIRVSERATLLWESAISGTYTVNLYRDTKLIKTYVTGNKALVISGIWLKEAGIYSAEIVTDATGYTTSEVAKKSFTVSERPTLPACTSVKFDVYGYYDYIDDVFYDYLYEMSWNHSISASTFMWKLKDYSTDYLSEDSKVITIFSQADYRGRSFSVYAINSGWKDSAVRTVQPVYQGMYPSSKKADIMNADNVYYEKKNNGN